MKGRVRYRERHSNRTPNAKSPSNELSNKTKTIRRPIISYPSKDSYKNMIHFYIFQKQGMLLISDLPKEKIKDKYGPIFEIVNSVRDKESLLVVKPKVTRSYPKLNVVEDFYIRKYFSEEYRQKLSDAKKGKARPDSVKAKISSKMKGKSNFEGKRHKPGSKMLTAISMRDNKNVKGKKWVYDPRADKEKRVDKIIEAPIGYIKGRDPDNVNQDIKNFSSW